MDIKIEPPILTGNAEEKERQLVAWLHNFCIELNLIFEHLEREVKKK